MTRRVVAALLVLTVAILMAAVVPLALGAIAHERDSFIQDTARSARSIAIIAEERLGDHAADPALSAALVSAARQHDELLVIDAKGKVVISQGVPHEAWKQLATEAAEQNGSSTELTGERVVAVDTVWGDGKQRNSSISRNPSKMNIEVE